MTMGISLQIFVSPQCFGCDRACSLADRVRRHFPSIAVRLIDVDQEGSPPDVVAVPTYMLNGRVISLGNPRDEDLFMELERAS